MQVLWAQPFIVAIVVSLDAYANAYRILWTCRDPDLAFAYSQLSKFVQYPGVVHLQAAERVLQNVRGNYDQGLTYFDRSWNQEQKLIGRVDSDFVSLK